MIEKLKEEAKALIDAGKYEEAKAKIDEVIAATPAEASDPGKKEPEKNDPPLPGEGENY